MFDLICDECKGQVVVDEVATKDAYLNDIDYSVMDNLEISDKYIQHYLVYRCMNCDKLYKFTYKEWESRYRKKLFLEMMRIRKVKMFREDINPYNIDPDNGIEFCGQCDGVDGDGNCFIDIIKQCTIRRKE